MLPSHTLVPGEEEGEVDGEVEEREEKGVSRDEGCTRTSDERREVAKGEKAKKETSEIENPFAKPGNGPKICLQGTVRRRTGSFSNSND